MPKGKIFLSRIAPSTLYRWEGLTVYRMGGPVRISKVWPTKVDYYFINDPNTIVSTSLREGFFMVAAWMPQALNKNKNVEEEWEYRAVRQSELVHVEKLLVKKSNDAYETNYDLQMAKAKIRYLYIDETTQEPSVVLDRQRLLSIQIPSYKARP